MLSPHLFSWKVAALLALLLGAAHVPAWAAGAAATESKEGAAQTGIYVTLDPMIVPVIANGVVQRHLTLQLQLEMRDIESDRRLQKRFPKLVDAFLSELHALMSMRFVREKGVDVEFFRARLLMRADALLGEGAIKEIYVLGIDKREPAGARG